LPETTALLKDFSLSQKYMRGGACFKLQNSNAKLQYVPPEGPCVGAANSDSPLKFDV
jgi:hypothetical protein